MSCICGLDSHEVAEEKATQETPEEMGSVVTVPHSAMATVPHSPVVTAPHSPMIPVPHPPVLTVSHSPMVTRE